MVAAIPCLHGGILLLVACLACPAQSLKTSSSGRSVGKAIKSITLSNDSPLQHEFLVCNAFASQKPLAVYRLRESRYITGDVPIAYKECRNFPLYLQEGEGFEFHAGDVKVGTFVTTGLPKASTTLLLVPMRRSPSGLSAKFQSHAFVESSTAQVAVVDAFRTDSTNIPNSKVKIADRGGDGDGEKGRRREEDLHFNSVVALGPGRYELSLAGGASLAEEQIALRTTENSRHVVMRVGMDVGNATDAKSYPQELVIFPQIAEVEQKSAASRSSFTVAAVGLLLVAVTAVVA